MIVASMLLTMSDLAEIVYIDFGGARLIDFMDVGIKSALVNNRSKENL